MKTVPFLIIAIILCLPAIGVSQVTDASQLYGTWQVNYENTLAHLTSNEQGMYDSLTTWVKDQIHDELINRRLELTTEAFILQGSNNHSMEGTWSFVESTQQLLFDPNQAPNFSVKIHSLSAEELVLQLADPSHQQVLVHYWYMDAVID